MRGSISPASMSTTRVPPMAVFISTLAAGACTTRPTRQASLPRGEACIARRASGAAASGTPHPGPPAQPSRDAQPDPAIPSSAGRVAAGVAHRFQRSEVGHFFGHVPFGSLEAPVDLRLDFPGDRLEGIRELGLDGLAQRSDESSALELRRDRAGAGMQQLGNRPVRMDESADAGRVSRLDLGLEREERGVDVRQNFVMQDTLVSCADHLELAQPGAQ